jgi:hypothetical protein
MTTSYNKSVFESIKNSLTKSSDSGLWSKVLKFEVGKTYTMRFIPNTKGGASLYSYQQHAWNDPETGKFTSVLSRKTFGADEVDPIGSLCYRVKKGGKFTPEEQEFANLVKWNEYTLVNVYVVDDPSNPENNGTVKIFKFGRKLAKQINSAICGEDESEYGVRVFDLTPNGVNFKLKVEKQGTYQVFDGSRFTAPVDLKLTQDEIESIHDSIYDLTSLNKEFSREEIQEIVDNNTKPRGASFSDHDFDENDVDVSSDEDVDDFKEVAPKVEVKRSSPNMKKPVVATCSNVLDDDDIEKLLQDD